MGGDHSETKTELRWGLKCESSRRLDTRMGQRMVGDLRGNSWPGLRALRIELGWSAPPLHEAKGSANVLTMKFPIFYSRRIWPLFVAFLAGACSDFATVPDRIPETLVIEPADTVVMQGDLAPLRLTVLDQDGNPFPPVPSWAPPAWSFSERDAVTVNPQGELEAVGGGELWVEARLAGLKALSRLRVNPNSAVLSAPAVYVVQSVQNPMGDVPLIAGVDGFLRIFVTTDPASFFQPRVRASFFLGDAEVLSLTLTPSSYLIPHEVDESLLERSFNAPIPGSILQPGLEMVIELDLDAVVPLAPGSRLRIPAEGRRLLDVRALPPFDLTVVPVLLAGNPDNDLFNWISNLTPGGATLEFTRSVLPIGELDLEVRESYTTSADLTTEAGWSTFLREIAALRLAEGSNRYYYGVTVLPSGSEYGGLGYIGRPTSVGRPTAATLAHELGHNLNLRHAPCGDVSSYDLDYPYVRGSIGVWGYESNSGSALGSLKDPDHYKDLMGYCTPKWISDYHFKKAMDFRLETETTPAEVGPRQSVLLLWGSAGEGEMILEPSFVLDAPAFLPTGEGPYGLEGRDSEGRVLFSLSFAPQEVEWGGGHFAFALPLGPEDTAALDAISLSGPEGAVTVDRSTRLPRMALVTDDDTGRIRAILRDGLVPGAVRGNTSVRFSQGLPGTGPAGRRN